MRGVSKGFTSKPRAKGAGKQFGGSSGRTPFTTTPKKATAAMQGRDPPDGTVLKSITRRDGKKNTVKASGKKVF